MNVLEVRNLCKSYPTFTLKEVSFSLEKGKITGFIGRNGAGKSTTLNSIMNLVHPDKGEIHFFGKRLDEAEMEIKQKIGFVSSGVDYYPNKKLKKITAITKMFYKDWDEAAYEKYLSMFALEEEKTPEQLSAGMKVKYALALALSHNAELLILDEPTSGLDPVSREDLLEVFMTLCDEGKTILFSTHITSDLDHCADNIIYIKGGRILAEEEIHQFVNSYRVVEFQENEKRNNKRKDLIGIRRSKNGYTGLVRYADAEKIGMKTDEADLESIMVHLEKEG